MTNEDSFPFIAFLDVNIIVSPSEIYLGEPLLSFQFVNKLRDQW
jgi:hypothetical protein